MTDRSSKQSAMATPHPVEPHAQQFLTVNGKRMAYVELGGGEPVFPLSARQPDLLLPVAQRHAGSCQDGPLCRAGSDWDGRFGQTRAPRPRYLPLCDTSRLFVG